MQTPVLTGAMLLLLAAVLAGCGKPAATGPSPIVTLESLRPVIAAAEPGLWSEKLEVSLTGQVFPMVGLGMKLTSIDPRVVRLVRGAREVAVQVYSRRSGPMVVKADGLPGSRRMLDAVSEKLLASDWERIIGLIDGVQAVAIFLPAGWEGLGEVSCCLLVREARELVVVSARMDPRPLMELASEMDLPVLPGR